MDLARKRRRADVHGPRAADKMAAFRQMPVSYTHLDVYKRQSLHLAETGRLIAKQSYVGKAGAEERGRGEKIEFFAFLIFFI